MHFHMSLWHHMHLQQPCGLSQLAAESYTTQHNPAALPHLMLQHHILVDRAMQTIALHPLLLQNFKQGWLGLLSSPLPLRPLARQRTHCQHDATLPSGLCMPVLNLKKILSWLPHCASQDKTPCANALPPPPPPTTHPHLHRRLACEPVGFQSCRPPPTMLVA